MLEHICFVSLYTGIGYPASAGYFYLLEVFMKKKNRNASSKVHDYSKYASKWNGVTIPSDDERYYGIHRDGSRIKIDIKRMKKIGHQVFLRVFWMPLLPCRETRRIFSLKGCTAKTT